MHLDINHTFDIFIAKLVVLKFSVTKMYISASVFFEKDDIHVFKARNSCCV